MANLLANFHPRRKGLKTILGELESQVMEAAWRGGEVTVRDVFDVLSGRREIAYTTVLTVMSRLEEKGLLIRKKVGKQFNYQPAVSREEFTRRSVSGVLDSLLENFSEPVFAHFVRVAGRRRNQQAQKIRELAKQILTGKEESGE